MSLADQLTVARIALDFPSNIAKFAGSLEAIALDDSFPHVGIRQVAVTILKTCLGKSKDSEAKAILKRIASVHVSKFSPYRPDEIFDFPSGRW